MSELADLLPAAIVAREPPGNGPGVVAYVGGVRPLTEALSGMDGPPVRTDYDDPVAYRADSTRWRSASRRAQRAAAPEGRQQRGRTRFGLTEEQRYRVRSIGTGRRLRAFRRGGMHVRIRAALLISDYAAVREMPSGGPPVRIAAAAARSLLDALVSDQETAAAQFETAFLRAYGVPGASIGNVVWLKVWPPSSKEEE